MKVHLITTILLLATFGAAQPPEAVVAKITTIAIEPGVVTLLHLAPGFTTSVRLPEEINSVVLGNPAKFKAEHSDSEPGLLFLCAPPRMGRM